jgi:hypothetical protein
MLLYRSLLQVTTWLLLYIFTWKVNILLWSVDNYSLYCRLTTMAWTRLWKIKINHQQDVALNPNPKWDTLSTAVSFKGLFICHTGTKLNTSYKSHWHLKCGLQTNELTHMQGTPVTRVPCKCAECCHQILNICFCHWANRQRNVYN